MRRYKTLIFAVAFAAIACSFPPPTANGQPGALPNPVAQVGAERGWTSDAQPRGTYAIVGGRGTPSQRVDLPSSIDIGVDGKIGPLNANPPGNQLRISNNSSHPIIIEFVLPGNTSKTPIHQEPPQVRKVAPRGSEDQKAGFKVPPTRYKPRKPSGPKWRLGLNYSDAPLGIRVTNVDDDTPAARLGLEPGDYILDVTGYPVGYHQGTYYDLSDILDKAADRQGWVNLRYWNFRNGQDDAEWIQLNRRR